MDPIGIFLEEQKKFRIKKDEYTEIYSKRDENGEIIEHAVMPHKGYNFSMSYDALELAM